MMLHAQYVSLSSLVVSLEPEPSSQCNSSLPGTFPVTMCRAASSWSTGRSGMGPMLTEALCLLLLTFARTQVEILKRLRRSKDSQILRDALLFTVNGLVSPCWAQTLQTCRCASQSGLQRTTNVHASGAYY